jgi:hypothetical protein
VASDEILMVQCASRSGTGQEEITFAVAPPSPRKVGFLLLGIIQQGPASAAPRHSAGIHRLHRGVDAAAAEIARKKRRADILGLRAGDDDRHRAGFFEKGQSVSHGTRRLGAAIPGNDDRRDRFCR